MGEVFLSYKAEDRARLKPLVAALEADGCQMWWDAHIGGGADWREEIQDHLDRAHCVIVAWSERSVGPDGRFVRDEATRALRRGAYLAISIDGVDPPLGFGELQAIPLGGWKGNRKDPRYQALLTAVRARLAGETPPPIPANLATPRISRRAAIAAGGVGLVAVAGGGWVVFGGKAKAPKRIAVMSFANLSGDPAQAYFSDGIAEELRGALSRIGLEVIGRASSDAVKDLDTKAAAAKLGVANILTGSVRRSPQTIRIGAQLVGGDDGVERWAQTYDRAPGDTIKIQSDIATSVAEALSIALGMAARAALTLGGTSDSVAQDLFLKAEALRRKSDSEESFKTCLGLLDAAIARDPNYADAYVERSSTLATLGAQYQTSPADGAMKLAQAEQAARKAIAIAPRLGAGYAMLSQIAASRLEFGEALAMTRRALTESPNSTRVLKSTAYPLIHLGDADEVLAHLTQGLSLDPLDATFHSQRAQAYYYSRHYNEAIDDARKALSVAPERQLPHSIIGNSLQELGKFAEAQVEYRKLPADDFFRIASEAIMAARTRDRAGAATRLARLQQSDGDAGSYQYGQIHAQLGETDRAFAALDKAADLKDPGLIALKKDPVLDPIRPDPRFAALLKRLKFP
jgi:TolB-like protein/Flp pilus assembly protein TadD